MFAFHQLKNLTDNTNQMGPVPRHKTAFDEIAGPVLDMIDFGAMSKYMYQR